MKEEIIKLSKSIGINEIGFCNTKKIIVDYEKYDLQEKLDYKCSFQIGNIGDKDLTNPIYDKYNTVICFLLSFNKVKCDDEDKVYFSGFALGEDYHLVLREKLEVISNFLNKNGYISDIFVDNNPLDEKLLAYNCGLGFFGKNNLLINKNLGSCFNIGVILTDLKVQSDKICEYSCGKCNLCILNCPTKALNENGILNQKKCLSYLTQKKNLEINEEKNFNNCIYGCDKCINICPYNNIIKCDDIGINIDEFLNMSESEFKNKYKNSAVYWRGKKVLDRNIQIYKNTR